MFLRAGPSVAPLRGVTNCSSLNSVADKAHRPTERRDDRAAPVLFPARTAIWDEDPTAPIRKRVPAWRLVPFRC